MIRIASNSWITIRLSTSSKYSKINKNQPQTTSPSLRLEHHIRPSLLSIKTSYPNFQNNKSYPWKILLRLCHAFTPKHKSAKLFGIFMFVWRSDLPTQQSLHKNNMNCPYIVGLILHSYHYFRPQCSILSVLILKFNKFIKRSNLRFKHA